MLTAVLASKVHPIPLKFLSKEGHFESYLAAWPLVRDVKLYKETSGRVTWARFSEPTNGQGQTARGPFLETPGNFPGPKTILGAQYSRTGIQLLLILKAKFYS